MPILHKNTSVMPICDFFWNFYSFVFFLEKNCRMVLYHNTMLNGCRIWEKKLKALNCHIQFECIDSRVFYVLSSEQMKNLQIFRCNFIVHDIWCDVGEMCFMISSFEWSCFCCFCNCAMIIWNVWWYLKYLIISNKIGQILLVFLKSLNFCFEWWQHRIYKTKWEKFFFDRT